MLKTERWIVYDIYKHIDYNTIFIPHLIICDTIDVSQQGNDYKGTLSSPSILILGQAGKERTSSLGKNRSARLAGKC